MEQYHFNFSFDAIYSTVVNKINFWNIQFSFLDLDHRRNINMYRMLHWTSDEALQRSHTPRMYETRTPRIVRAEHARHVSCVRNTHATYRVYGTRTPRIVRAEHVCVCFYLATVCS